MCLLLAALITTTKYISSVRIHSKVFPRLCLYSKPFVKQIDYPVDHLNVRVLDAYKRPGLGIVSVLQIIKHVVKRFLTEEGRLLVYGYRYTGKLIQTRRAIYAILVKLIN